MKDGQGKKSNHVIYSLSATGTITDSISICLTATGLLEIKYERDGTRTTRLVGGRVTGIKHPV
jgi:hypothetical protein